MRSLLLLLLVFFALPAGDTPEATLKEFVDCFNQRDIDGAAKKVQGGTVPPQLRQGMREVKSWPSMSISNLKSTITGNNAQASFSVSSTGMGVDTPHKESIDLVRVGNEWLIVSPKAKDPSQGYVAGFASMFTDGQVFVNARSAAKKTACLSNLKQLSLGFLMFATDNDDVLKMSASNWRAKIMPYVKNKQLFTCPEDKPGTISYSFNSKLANKSLAAVLEPAMTVLVYEGSNGSLAFKHADMAAVAFTDGHAKFYRKESARTLRWTLK